MTNNELETNVVEFLAYIIVALVSLFALADYYPIISVKVLSRPPLVVAGLLAGVMFTIYTFLTYAVSNVFALTSPGRILSIVLGSLSAALAFHAIGDIAPNVFSVAGWYGSIVCGFAVTLMIHIFGFVTGRLNMLDLSAYFPRRR